MLRVTLAATIAAALSLLAACGDSKAPAVATTPSVSGSIVYEKEVGEEKQVYTARLDGTGERRLTRVDGDALQPRWSPDGKRIAFFIEHKNHKPHPYCSVALMNADGSDLRDLVSRRSGCDGGPSFTPDGRRIVFGTYDEIKDVEGLASMNLAGRDRRDIKTPWRTGVGNPTTSPDGKWIAFVRIKEDSASNSLFVMRPDGSQRRRVTPESWGISDRYDWSPDSKLIVLTTHAHFAKPGESANVVTIRPDGTIATRITRFTGAKKHAFSGSFSPDGKRVVIRLEQGDKYALAVVDRDGRNLRRLTKFGKNRARYIDWAPQP